MDETGAPEPTTTEVAEYETPKQGMSTVAVVLISLVALFVGIVIGGAIGWKVEQQRVKDDLANIRPVGTITKVGESSITMKLLTGDGSTTFAITDGTVVEAIGAGAPSLDEGATVLVKSKKGSGDDREAVEIIVLPEGSALANSGSGS